MARSKISETIPLGANVSQKVLSESADSSVRPLTYNESWSGGQTPVAFSGTNADELVSSVPVRLCQIHCLTATVGATIAVYDLATASHASGLVYGPVPIFPGGTLRPMLQTTTGVSVTITGTVSAEAMLEGN